ncbi:Ldh family oxidoreductase [Paracoccus sp. MC1862]|uniref:Ldh family oxidoreductase n=1 Tax=Paracoccus sp. MC1862 TaxID=2760307 RepID=UPI0015FEC314|nr:Ldh family oxidoreductase [Paracoccus sp. MC1862]MBB1497517.1 Ldh family oxidoreductase [Paracoccus sp. MC1862]QQO45989.1 Ldh family oxidoreductase [Paracoccus sp. MC1862]
MTDEIRLSEAETYRLAHDFLTFHGLSQDQSAAMAGILTKAQRDGSLSHGLQRLPGTLETMGHPAFDREAVALVTPVTPAVVRVDAGFGFSISAALAGLPALIERARALGIAMLAVNNGFHSTALWPVVEEIAESGLVALSMNPTHDWVAPAGGTRPVLGTNPLAFAWPRAGKPPYVFDFATTAASRADIALHRQAGKAISEGWGLDPEGRPTTDPAEVLSGAMLPFGGHKGSALATMIELMAGPFIGDRTSRQSAEFDAGQNAAPCHGELIIAFDPALLSTPDDLAAAESVLDAIEDQGARLPGSRRHAERARNLRDGIPVSRALHERIRGLMEG